MRRLTKPLQSYSTRRLQAFYRSSAGTGGAGASNLFRTLSNPASGGVTSGTGAPTTAGTGGLFSSSAEGNKGGLFGSATAPSSAGSGTSGGLFGTTSSSGLFGARPSGGAEGGAPQPAQTASGGLLGSTSSSSTTSGGGLFGSGTAAFGSDKGSSLFGLPTGGGASGSTGGLFGSFGVQSGSSPGTVQGGNSGAAGANVFDAPKVGLFVGGAAAAAKSQDGKPGGPQGGLTAPSGASTAGGSGLFGSATPAASSKPDAHQGGLLGPSALGSTETAKPSGGLFGSAGSSGAVSGAGGAFTTNKPAALGTGAPDAGKSVGLFGSLGGTTPGAGSHNSLFGGGNSAAGEAAKGNEEKGEGVFGGAGASPAVAAEPAKGDIQQSGTAAGSSLFGFGATGGATAGSRLLSSAPKLGATDQQGTGAAPTSTATPAASEQKTSTGSGLFGASGGSAVPPSGGTLFGAKTGGNAENATSATGSAASNAAAPAGAVASPEEVALATMQHERMDDLLANWERRLQRKVAQFDELAQDVAVVEASLIAQSKALASIREEQQRVHRRQLLVGEAIEMIEQQQHDLSNLLASIESNLLAKLSAQEQRSLFSTIEQSMSQRVLDIDAQMDEVAAALAAAARRTQAEPVAAISQVLAVHQAALQSATQQCAKLEQCLKSLQRYVT
ncbi:hypothetical protein ACSSS7_001923 [Eimeria intestinalis]